MVDHDLDLEQDIKPPQLKVVDGVSMSIVAGSDTPDVESADPLEQSANEVASSSPTSSMRITESSVESGFDQKPSNVDAESLDGEQEAVVPPTKATNARRSGNFPSSARSDSASRTSTRNAFSVKTEAKHDAIHGVGVIRSCDTKWNDMVGDERSRTCKVCHLKVFETSELAASAANATLADGFADHTAPADVPGGPSAGASLKTLLFRRGDGTYVLGDCYAVRHPYVATWRRVMTKPQKFFTEMPYDAGLSYQRLGDQSTIAPGTPKAMMFYVLLSVIDITCWAFVLFLLGAFFSYNHENLSPVRLWFAPLWMVVPVVIGSMTWNVIHFLSAFFGVHLLSRALGGKAKFEESYRVSAYSSAPIVLRWIPIVNLLATAYSIYLLYLGIKQVHGLSRQRAAIVATIVGVVMLLFLFFTTMFLTMDPGLGILR